MASSVPAVAPTTSSASYSNTPAPDHNSAMPMNGHSNPQNNGSNMSPAPSSNGFSSRRFAPEPNKRALYVGGLDANVTKESLQEIFEDAIGGVQSVRIVTDGNRSDGNRGKGNYAFVLFDDPASAQRAMEIQIPNSSMIINWAYQSNNGTPKPDTTKDSHVFVGDLSNEVTDEILYQAFSAFGTISEARVMWDMKTGRSRGYGFVAYPNRDHADKAIAAMNGEWLGSRAIRCNWANQKGQPSMGGHQDQNMSQMQGNNFAQNFNFPQGNSTYETVVNQTPQWQTTCYVGNLTPYTTQADLVPLFRNFGYVVEARCQSDRGFAFIKMDSHENAAMAILQLNGYMVNGRPLKCSWGKDRPPNGQFEGYNNGPNPSGFSQNNVGFFPQYNGPPGPIMPQGMSNQQHTYPANS